VADDSSNPIARAGTKIRCRQFLDFEINPIFEQALQRGCPPTRKNSPELTYNGRPTLSRRSRVRGDARIARQEIRPLIAHDARRPSHHGSRSFDARAEVSTPRTCARGLSPAPLGGGGYRAYPRAPNASKTEMARRHGCNARLAVERGFLPQALNVLGGPCASNPSLCL